MSSLCRCLSVMICEVHVGSLWDMLHLTTWGQIRDHKIANMILTEHNEYFKLTLTCYVG